MLKTIFVDGDKGGVGKSLVAKAIADMYLHGSKEFRLPEAQVVIVDADRANPDLCGTGGFKMGGRLAETHYAALDTEEGWREFGDKMEPYIDTEEEIRVIVSMPAQIGPRAFEGDIPLVNEVMRVVNAVPVWVLSRTRDSIDALDFRLRNMPARYTHGVVVKNLFFGASEKFGLWQESAARLQTIVEGNWMEVELPEMNDILLHMIGRAPFQTALEQGTAKGQLGLGSRLSLETWRRTAWGNLMAVELVGSNA